MEFQNKDREIERLCLLIKNLKIEEEEEFEVEEVAYYNEYGWPVYQKDIDRKPKNRLEEFFKNN